jgi:SAM-dependent methyltransferase
MTTENVDVAYLAYQYGDAEKLRVRIDTHSRYSELRGEFRDWLMEQAGIEPGQRVLDVGCGPGAYHAAMAAAGARVIATDLSPGMAAEARGGAQAAGLRVTALVADAQALPLRGATFERVMANHMLYHVPDIELALREIRRVLKPGGRAVLATNAAGNYAALDELHREAASAHGFTATVADSSRFTLDDLPLVQSVFPNARMVERRDALVFRDTGPVVRFYATYHIDDIEARPADGSHRPLLMAEMERLVSQIIEREGVLRIPKTAGCFVADV